MRDHTEDRLSEFLQAAIEPFTIKGLLDYLGEPSGRAAQDELSDYLTYNQLAFLNPAFDAEDETWITRAGIFTGKSVVVIPTKEEIADGILLPGSRLVPFYDPAILPNELVFRYKGEVLSRLVLEVSPEEAYPHYAMFGDEYIPQYLALDNDENADLFSPDDYYDPPEFPVSVVNMRAVYWDADFKPGDRIIATAVDWAKGVFDVEPMAAKAVDRKARDKWFADFEENLIRSFEVGGAGAAIDEQLSLAWFFGQDRLFTPHAATMDEFLKWTSRVSIEPYGIETRLWFTDREIPPQGNWDMTMVSTPASVTEELFAHLGMPFTDLVLDSYVLDALHRKESDVKPMLERIFPARTHVVALCIPILERELGRFYRDFAKDYNWFADHDTAMLRNRYVELHNGLSDFVGMLKAAKIKPELVPEQGAVVLSQLLNHVVSGIEALDAGYFLSDEEKAKEGKKALDDQETLWASVESMEDSFFDIKTAILDALPELKKRNFSLLKRKKETPPDA